MFFLVVQGTDPASDLYKFAEEMRFGKKLNAISLGQGQGSRAELLMRTAMERGFWVFFQNCHLSPSWMPSLERLVEQIDMDKVRKKTLFYFYNFVLNVLLIEKIFKVDECE